MLKKFKILHPDPHQQVYKRDGKEWFFFNFPVPLSRLQKELLAGKFPFKPIPKKIVKNSISFESATEDKAKAVFWLDVPEQMKKELQGFPKAPKKAAKKSR